MTNPVHLIIAHGDDPEHLDQLRGGAAFIAATVGRLGRRIELRGQDHPRKADK